MSRIWQRKPTSQITSDKSKNFRTYLRLILFIAFTIILIFSGIMLYLGYMEGVREEKALKSLAETVDSADIAVPPYSDDISSEIIEEPESEEPEILIQYRELYEQNEDMVGWIQIEDTEINYPVMYTADDFYLNHSFDKMKSQSGVPFIDKRCEVEPFGTNTIIYGHNMNNGTMFAGIIRYKDMNYYKEHPIIHFDTLYEKQEYEIFAVFESKVYRKSDKVFKHYNFLNAENELDFNEYINSVKALSLYDTGVAAKYGDELITLMTCSYQTENGRFVVVARKIQQAD